MEKLKANATSKEVGAFLVALGKDAGPQADTYASIRSNGSCSLSLYPTGITRDGHVTGTGDDWAVASGHIIKNWNAQRSNHRAVTIRKMALEIIQITADQGECTDRALRLTFDQTEIDALGAEAAEMANDMASNGPFSIKATSQANAA